ncbi:MAG TPA: hypothetical protein VJS15_09420 [Allosphingosinicella sp.]|nr:hypothetical protein [Allosphingosinicella sp.]
MADRTGYLNTDLELVSKDDLTALATYLKDRKWSALHAGRRPDGTWLGVFEAPHGDQEAPEPTISTMLALLSALPEPLQKEWRSCSKRDFNIGYQAGTDRRLEQALPNDLLKQIAALGASISITLYPAHESPAAQ